VYLFLCVLGVLLPYSRFLPWLRAHGPEPSLFLSELFSTRIGAFFGMDVIVSALALFVFMGIEGRRLAVRKLWLPAAATILVGVSLGLPLFLYMRQVVLEREAVDPSISKPRPLRG
jgi:hypothetical protein